MHGFQERYKVTTKDPRPQSDLLEPVIYQIRVDGHLGQGWTDWFEGLSIRLEEDGKTLLTGPVIDQPALYGLLKKVRDLGMPLISVQRLELGQADASEVNPSAPMQGNSSKSFKKE
jgi:hypothetical protein